MAGTRGQQGGAGRFSAPGPPALRLLRGSLGFRGSHSALVMDTQPWPLQLFMPLQLFFADLHSDVPLQEFTPEQ